MPPETEKALAGSNPLQPTAPLPLPPGRNRTSWLSRSWLWFFLVVYGLWVGLPFLAPVFMYWGWETPARLIYGLYSFFCHQMPQRSLFFFGPKTMYSLADIQRAWQDTTNPLILRQFIGNPQMGWKMAWSDRMISAYGGVWLAALLWGMLKALRGGKISRLPWWGAVLLALPMALDGGTHFLSDLAGIGQGFRYTNAWLAVLTNNAFSPTFYAGDALGSFNSWMRWISGFLFAFGLVWWLFPLLHESFQASVRPTVPRAPYSPVEDSVKT